MSLPCFYPSRFALKPLPLWSALFALAVFLRFFHLGSSGLWLDEFASWRIASGPLALSASEATNPPLYYALLHFWVRLFGTSEAALRSLSILPSLGLCWLAWYWVSRNIDSRPALIATAYLAISPFQLYYAQEARCYALLSFAVFLSSMLLWQIVTEENPSPRRLLGLLLAYTVVSTVSLYTHFIASLFIAAHGLFALLVLYRQPKRLLQLGCAAGCTLLLFLPWLLRIAANQAQSGQARRYLWLKVPQAYFSFIFGDSLVPLDEQAVRNIAQTVRESWWILALAIVSLSVLGLYFARFQRLWPRPLLFLLIMSAVPVLLALIVSFKTMIFDERYLIAASTFVVVLIAVLIHLAWDRLPGRLAVAGFVLLCCFAVFRFYFDPRIGKDQWREAIAYVDASAASQDLILFDPDFISFSYGYYGKRSPAPALLAVIPGKTDPKPAIASHSRIWLIRAYHESDSVLDAVRSSATQSSFETFSRGHGIEVFSFTRQTP